MIKKINSSIIGLGFGETHLKCFKKIDLRKFLKFVTLMYPKKYLKKNIK